MHCTITVAASAQPRMCCPASVTLPKPDDAPSWRLYEMDESGHAVHEVECQYEQNGTLTWVIDYQDANTPVKYLARSGSMPDASGVLINEEETRVDVLVHGKVLTAYHFSPPEGSGQLPRPFFYPLMAPNGTGLTRGYPLEKPGEGGSNDHPHHRSFWTALGDVNGADHWSEHPNHGWQVHQGIVERIEGGVFGRLVCDILWQTHDHAPQLRERRTLTVYDTAGMLRVLDYTTALTALDRDVVIADTKQGGKEGGFLSIRVNDALRVKGGSGLLINSRGQRNGEVWGKPAAWIDNTGTTGGISLLDHPQNPRHPTTWHAREYGLVTANPIGLHDFDPESGKRGDLTIAQGETLTMRYRILLHDGKFTPDDITNAYECWSNPPQISVGR